jgi:hypothetical protein
MNERVIADMLATAKAHEQWAESLEATASEAATGTVFATQIRSWVETLEAATPNPARIKALDEGKARGSATETFTSQEPDTTTID